ncbi:hypothetical protein [Gordonia sp. WA4-43]|uniref:hypothetical protein n=1 Tax=Gordonia sp. WA4-43 TaxID=2878678 RepID=UPI001CF9BC1C|nr:hypothetical protein [Gordonia sp. WA4-43]UCZ88692.1 hypothetical protein LEL84_16605 [Gordonia sp. WA4-43]
MKMTRGFLWPAAVLSSLTLALVGCSGTETPNAGESTTSTSTTATTTTSSSAAAETSTTTSAAAAAMSMDDALTAAGADCAAGTGERDCTLNGVSFTLSDSWKQSAGMRERACTEGYINTDYQVLTDGTSYISSDYDTDYPAIASALEEQGVTVETTNYCP